MELDWEHNLILTKLMKNNKEYTTTKNKQIFGKNRKCFGLMFDWQEA